MNDEYQFSIAFLQDLDVHHLDELRKRREAWGMDARDFRDRLDAWFSNFHEGDRPTRPALDAENARCANGLSPAGASTASGF